MEYTTIIGIVIAVIIMLFGVRMIFRKPADAAPSLESALHIDADVKNRLFRVTYVTNCRRHQLKRLNVKSRL